MVWRLQSADHDRDLIAKPSQKFTESADRMPAMQEVAGSSPVAPASFPLRFVPSELPAATAR